MVTGHPAETTYPQNPNYSQWKHLWFSMNLASNLIILCSIIKFFSKNHYSNSLVFQILGFFNWGIKVLKKVIEFSRNF